MELSDPRNVITVDEGISGPTAVHPGEALAEALQDLGLSPGAFAKLIDASPGRITTLLACQTRINADMSLRLGRYFGTSAKMWMDMQSAYDLRLASALSGRAIIKHIKPREGD